MTEIIETTPDLSVPYCPGCDPERDEALEILRVYWCSAHDPALRGLDDPLIVADRAIPAGTEESEGGTNRAMADLLRESR